MRRSPTSAFTSLYAFAPLLAIALAMGTYVPKHPPIRARTPACARAHTAAASRECGEEAG